MKEFKLGQLVEVTETGVRGVISGRTQIDAVATGYWIGLVSKDDKCRLFVEDELKPVDTSVLRDVHEYFEEHAEGAPAVLAVRVAQAVRG